MIRKREKSLQLLWEIACAIFAAVDHTILSKSAKFKLRIRELIDS